MMSMTCILRRVRLRPWLPAALVLTMAGTGCRNESEKAEGAIRDQAKEVRDQAGEVKEETRELGSDIRELQQRNREAWMQAGRAGDYQVELNPDGAVVASKSKPAAGSLPSDDVLRQTVSSKLSTGTRPGLQNVTLSVQNGVITLRGKVADFKEAEMVVHEVIDSDGVTRVISYLQYGT